MAFVGNDTNTQQITSEKDLGVIFDEKLLFREHIAKTAAVANRNLGLIFKSLHALTEKSKRSPSQFK